MQEKLGGKVPERIILRTDWSDHFGQMPFYTQYPFLTEKAAQWLVENGVRLIAMDTPSPDNPAHSRGTAKDSPNHKVLLGAGVVLVEYVCNLKSLTSQDVELIVLPLKLKGLRWLAGAMHSNREVKIGSEESRLRIERTGVSMAVRLVRQPQKIQGGRAATRQRLTI